jgi:16S rRNA (guanine527-N7)-methyltransferase
MKGRSATEEVAASHASWHARIELVPSLTDSDAAIVVATGVKPRKGNTS